MYNILSTANYAFADVCLVFFTPKQPTFLFHFQVRWRCPSNKMASKVTSTWTSQLVSWSKLQQLGSTEAEIGWSLGKASWPKNEGTDGKIYRKLWKNWNNSKFMTSELLGKWIVEPSISKPGVGTGHPVLGQMKAGGHQSPLMTQTKWIEMVATTTNYFFRN